jgi:nicotinamidase/pyrazinamidase
VLDMSMAIDPDRDALVIVDVQNDFCPGGALAVPDGDQVVPVLNRYAGRFERAGAPVFASRDWHPPVTRHFKAHGGVWPPHCVQGTAGADFHPGLRLPEGTEIVSKGADPESDAYSCFQAETADGMPFAAALGDHGVGRLFVGGLATDYCVKATVLDALKEGFEVVLLTDAVRPVDLAPGDGERAVAAMTAAGARTARLDDLA